MIKKEVVVLLGILGVLTTLMVITGCIRINEMPVCAKGQVVLAGVCCFDTDADNICDSEYCGDGTCQEDEDCVSCWKDCGACKKIIYTYIPRNYTLRELTDDLDLIYADDVKFRRDIEVSDQVSKFFYFENQIPRVFGFFMSIDYRLFMFSRRILLSNIITETFYINNSDSFMDYLNYTRWYRIHQIMNADQAGYANRILRGQSLKDYPTPHTGHEKESKFADWEYRNVTMETRLLLDNTTMIEEGIVEDIYAAIYDYDIKYKYHEYVALEYSDDTDDIILEDFKYVEELGFGYVHTMNIFCSDDLVITLYEYEYKEDEYQPQYFDLQFRRNREHLLTQAKRIKAVCDKKYAGERFIYS